jgi:hypothetical protein
VTTTKGLFFIGSKALSTEKTAKWKEFHALLTLVRQSKETARRVAASVKLLYQSLPSKTKS